MHIHSMGVNPAGFYAASEGERAANAQRAAEVRKKLLKSAAQIDGRYAGRDAAHQPMAGRAA